MAANCHSVWGEMARALMNAPQLFDGACCRVVDAALWCHEVR